MKPLRTLGQSAFAALLCLSLVVWSVVPAVSHASAVFETLQEHATTIAEHGHSHWDEEDFQRALHGHGHDAADHDHSEAMQSLADGRNTVFGYGDVRCLPPSRAGPSSNLRIDRPPRA